MFGLSLQNLLDNPVGLWLFSFVCWFLLYLFFSYFVHKYAVSYNIPDNDKAQVSEGLVSSFQGFFCGGVGIITVLATQHDVVKAKYWFAVPYSTIGSAYFIYDLLAMYYSHSLHKDSKGLNWRAHFKRYLQRNMLMFAHHIILIFILFPALVYYSGMGDFFTGCFYLTEISTPFVNMRVILHKFGMKSSKLYIVNGVLMTIVFAMCRVVMFPFMYLTFLNQTSKGLTYLQALTR